MALIGVWVYGLCRRASLSSLIMPTTTLASTAVSTPKLGTLRRGFRALDAGVGPPHDGGGDRFHTVSVLCVPLHNDKNQCVAVVQAVNKLAFRGPSTALSPRPSTSHDAPVTTFPEESQSLLERIGDIAGGLLHRLQLEEQAVRSWWHACQTTHVQP